MSAAAAPTVAAPSADDVNPIDALDLSEFGADAGADLSAASVPESMQLGGSRPSAPPAETAAAPTPDANAPAAITRPEDGAIWSESAKRWYNDGKIVAGAAPAGAAKPGDLAPASPSKVEAPDPAIVDDATAADAPVPFKYRAMQETHELKDALLDPKTGDLTIKAASVGQIRQALNALHARDVEVIPTFDRLQKENADYKARVTELESGQGQKEAMAGQLMDQLQNLFTMPDEDAAAKLFFKMRDDFPRLQLEGKAKYWEQQAKRGKGPGAPATAPKAPADAPTAPESLRATPEMALDATRSYIEDQKVTNLALRDLTAEDWQQYNALIGKTPYAFARPATAADAKEYGVRAGEDVFDNDLALEHLTAFATARRAARATAASSAKVAAQNARTTQPTIDAPPVPGADRVPTATAKVARINSREDYEAYMNSDEI